MLRLLDSGKTPVVRHLAS